MRARENGTRGARVRCSSGSAPSWWTRTEFSIIAPEVGDELGEDDDHELDVHLDLQGELLDPLTCDVGAEESMSSPRTPCCHWT
jgi:hypothetical protein